ncbi:MULTISPECIES: TetR/AcrR family transcriptional regulator [unclassified Microbacterium]|uniref:TetR/AcrR family transcriptional regulator n=1 Tax=unclassified Microbacterium TaxID=2609290 RepID=UPI000CFD32CA|nr:MULTISPECIES: TetR/AcrR family transcriptional regulator [unclassified Microbacterium]PQZ53505.1 TetR family transcriptional regulator [Microbacterium sp. MYb43]PQZ75107.1 TetR family transcriptional regulator [Microbacterium sp. MYb40]PRB19402.1 TetR family transcriptional regulator [Microbacterium sp. MYb54]PRB24603.1 TetR family transcriptional regulator [Microbacterium sp. MYb50]PRB63714.1 TetR family transcriptional regulator [Microbacterium sp. MYb24]
MNAEPTRRDATRNRKRIVDVARGLVDDGSAVQLNEVARLAGVGVATVYRNFPSVEALIEELATPSLESLIGHAKRALDNEDPWQSLADFLGHTIEAQVNNPALSTVNAALVNVLPRTVELKATLGPLAGQLLDRARRSRAVRSDLTSEDVIPLMCGIAFAVTAHDVHRRADRDSRVRTAHRYLTMLLTGLRA